MRILVLGSGGREHALVWAVRRSPLVEEVLCAPGSDAIARDARVFSADPCDLAQVVALAKHESVDLVVVGPEDPLAAGVADALTEAGTPVFGPSREAAQLESSKSFAKAFMARHSIPTAAHESFSELEAAEHYATEHDGPLVVKADGLAAGKGVFMCADAGEAVQALREIMRERRFGAAGASVVIEEQLLGEELSFYAISDGERFVCLDAAQDFKRALDGGRGENTGGMGAYSPVPLVGPELAGRIVERVVAPTLAGMRAEGRPYRGVLFVGLMIRDGQPSVIEYNARFGDPETQALLFRLESDLVPLLDAAARGRLPDDAAESLRFGPPAVCVVMASEGYPRGYPTDLPIRGLEELEARPDVGVFHSGTALVDGAWRTRGGRVLGVTARGTTLGEARERAYQAAASLHWKGAFFRRDIAAAAAALA